MPLLGRTPVRTHTALSILALLCANPCAAEPTTLAMLRPHLISPSLPSRRSAAARLASAPPVVKLAKIAFEC